MRDPPGRAAAARPAARAILDAFVAYRSAFLAITRRARIHFESRDWAAAQADARDRLDTYRASVDWIVSEVGSILGNLLRDRPTWHAIRTHYASMIEGRGDIEIAETWFNSVTRRVFATFGVDDAVEFVKAGNKSLSRVLPVCRAGGGCIGDCELECACQAFLWHGPVAPTLRELLSGLGFKVPFQDIEADVAAGSRELEAAIAAAGLVPPGRIEVLRPIFFRNKGAYVVGRIRASDRLVPLVLAILNEPGGLHLDAALTSGDEASIVFSFTRAYFQVEAEHPRELVAFLRTLMPAKPVGELYAAIGEHKHGKTELFRQLRRHFEATGDMLEVARGERGLVMVVFGPEALDVVFKVIRDRPVPPKDATRREVMDRYRLVFQSDRVGRLVDATEFEHMAFPRARFAPGLLDELHRTASGTVAEVEGQVVVHHLYAERRVVPLDLRLREAGPEEARRLVLDYGQAIRDLAAADIFPGDLLLKNFGVTRHGRVVFYDYDELRPLTRCRFRAFPSPRDEVEAASDEPFFHVGRDDVFPEEHLAFLGFTGPLRDAFLDVHADLFSPAWWVGMQERIRSGDLPDVFPYPPERRLRR